MNYNNRKKPVVNPSFWGRVSQNYDVVLATLGAVIVLGYMGFPISKETTTTVIK